MMYFSVTTSFFYTMKEFKDYFNRHDIILYLCKIRAKEAKSKNKKHSLHLLTKKQKYNYHVNDQIALSDYEIQFNTDFDKLFPCRKLWKRIGESSRYKAGSKQKITSIDRNVYSLQKTINYYRRTNPDISFLTELDLFIQDVKDTIENPNYNISSPSIYPKPKVVKKEFELGEQEFNICRPISLFNLKDRLILSFTNKFLTQLFDEYFEDCSLAFRAVRKTEEGKILVNHHTAIKRILQYKNEHLDSALWVAECDMKKFYDTVNHEKIISLFSTLIDKCKVSNPLLDLTIPERIFYSYLNCYSFNRNILPLNLNNSYWEKYKIVKGEFGWVQADLSLLYENFNVHKIGIPQGGALSGLIANIVLDYADKKIIEDNLLYIRFCDDMIMIHPSHDICKRKINEYKEILNTLLLVPHNFCENDDLITERSRGSKFLPEKTLVNFWTEKSKLPYKWDKFKNGGFPWIGFVGYEISFKGELRVRKCSLNKELKKQNKVVSDIRSAASEERRVDGGTVIKSAIHKLIGMSVGRVEIWNYEKMDNELCWKNGFCELNRNKKSIQQIKQLDRNRNKLYYKLISDYKELRIKKTSDDEESTDPQIHEQKKVKYSKPFSYYYQVFEK
jgi:hypothetical protein